MPEPILAYGVPPRAGLPTAVLCGVPAVCFAVVVIAASAAENYGYVSWHGGPVVGLWACLAAGPVMGIAAVVSGLRAARRRPGRGTAAILGVVAGVIALAGFTAFVGYVISITQF